jgi:DNA/RNA endonuclease G (NUC1)
VSIDEIEKRTGFDFLRVLPKEVQQKIEAVRGTAAWLK